MSDQVKIPCMFIRGGTSRGPYFLKNDLPSDVKKRDKILLAAMGSPDLRQIDGLGGAEPVKSKVAIIDKSSEEGIDVDYYFAQVKIDKPIVDTKPSCGNILVGVGPYAIEKGLVEAKNSETSIIVRDKNTGMKIEQIIHRTRNGGGELVSLMKNSSAFFSPASSAIEMLESFLFNQKKLLPCSAYLSGQYGFKDIFVGVPVIIGKNGIEKIVELKLSKESKKQFSQSVTAVNELLKKCKKLLV